MKVAQQPQKPPDGSNQIWAMTSGKKDTSSNLRGLCTRLDQLDQTYRFVDTRSKVAMYTGLSYDLCHVRKIHFSDLLDL